VATPLRRVCDRLDPFEKLDPSENVAEGSGLDDLLRLLFPDGLDEHQRERVLAAIGHDDPFAPPTVRRVVGALDQQSAASPVVVRLGPDDVEHFEIDVDGRTLVLVLDRADASVSVQIRDDGVYEPYVSAVLDRLLGPGDVFVDVGANVGYHTARAAVRVGPTGRVLAVEANPENARLLALTVAANDLDQVEVLPLALGDRLGHVNFGSHIGSNGGFAPDDVAVLASGRATVVPVVPLDSLGLERLDVMKIDVEGAESVVVAGGVDTIRRCRPVIVTEFSCEMTRRVGGIEPREHLDRLVELGYTLHVIDRTGGPPVAFESSGHLLADWGSDIRLEDLLLLPATVGP
jgi:FkbM family methyltransferase